MTSMVDENVVQAWKDDPLLYNRGTTTSKIANIVNRKIGRPDVTENKTLLLPVIEHLGLKPDIYSLRETCRSFLMQTRPRGKPELRGNMDEPVCLFNWFVFFLGLCNPHVSPIA